MADVVLCLGSAADETFLYTVGAIERAGCRTVLIDLGELVLTGRLQMPLGRLEDAVISLPRGDYVVNDFAAVWIRLIDLSEAAPSRALRDRAIGFQLSLAILFGGLGGPRIINPPMAGASGFAKMLHSVSLASSRWQLPRSLVTNSEVPAREFVAGCPNGAIAKGTSGAKTWVTAIHEAHDWSRISTLRASPVLFQERIIGPDVRAHVVGSTVIAEQSVSAQVDYRRDRQAIHKPVMLPLQIEDGCREIACALNLPFLGIDFKRQDETGEWFFLEANSMPSYQGYDIRARGAISRAVVAWLMREV